jgi:hypothetical protein
VALDEEAFGNGDSGKQVAASATACDEDFHKLIRLRVSTQSREQCKGAQRRNLIRF